MRVLMIGDVVGRPGRKAVRTLLPGLRREHDLDLVIANGENASGGFGINYKNAQELYDSGVDVITSGNHIWDQRDIIEHLDSDMPILRPLNYPADTPGRGYLVFNDVLVINLIGRLFVGTFDCPFRGIDRVLDEMNGKVNAIIVDLHAEATSEKEAMGWYLDGRVSVMAGTHTHVPTADTRILPKGTAYVSDLGMVGALESIIGAEPEAVLARFLTQTPRRLKVEESGPMRFNSVLIELDDSSGKASCIRRLDMKIE